MVAEEYDFSAGRKRLWNELVVLHDAWAQYTYLFNESNERIRLLNCCARWFFGTSQRVLMREVILGISRLTDPPNMGQFSNLVMAGLLTDPAVEDHPGLKEELKTALDKLAASVTPIRKHRDKYIAHLDLEAAVRPTEVLIPGLKKGLLGDVIGQMAGVYNLHGIRTLTQQAHFALDPAGSPQSLVAILEKSDEWVKCQKYDARSRRSAGDAS